MPAWIPVALTGRPSRRRLLAGLGAVAVAPVLLAVPDAAAAPEAPPVAAEPECLADLIASGEVTRADLVAR